MRAVEQFFRVIAPSSCLSCGNEGSLLCVGCSIDALPKEQSRCCFCNSLTKDYAVCKDCRRKTPLKNVFTTTEYTSYAKDLVHVMKFKYSGEAADIIAREMAESLPSLPPETVIAPVPTITSHLRQRGLDHTKRIAKRISLATDYRYANILLRVGQERQVGASRRDRMTQMQGAFRAKNDFLIKGVDIVVIDDVVTTGSTLDAAAKELKKAGARSVRALVFSRAR